MHYAITKISQFALQRNSLETTNIPNHKRNCKLYTNEIYLTQTSKILTKLMYTTYI